MQSVSSLEEQIAALLHDVVEDTDWTQDHLRGEGFTAPVIDAIACLTHADDGTYEDYIENLSSDPIARRVKLADLTDNMNLLRLFELEASDLERMKP